MNNIFKPVTGLLMVLVLICCQKAGNNSEDGMNSFNADSLRYDISILASDSFLGRKPFTLGETRTIRFLQKRFAEAGLEPGNGESFLQDVPMAEILAVADPVMQVKSPRGTIMLNAYDDYVIWTNRTDEHISLSNNEVVFAGYGVVAPEYNRNDYEGLDVKDKIVLVMVNDPGFRTGDSTLFRGDTMTYYGRWTYKFEEAARQGAKGCLVIHNTRAASYPFIVLQNSFNTPQLQLDQRGKNVRNCDVIGWIPEAVTKRLFEAAGYDSSLFVKANEKGFKPVPLNLRLSTSMKVRTTYNKSYNVIGKITGSKRPDEVIIYTAHWDHLGIGRPDDTGDTVYNGALDNASAVAGLLELARAFKSMKTPPERTIVFLAVTGEEQGLLGSEYYVQNPLYPLAKTVADINMECLNWSERTRDMVIVGAGQSDLEDSYRNIVVNAGGYLSAEQHPEAGSFFRSDHFSFARAGVPALYPVTGTDIEDRGKAYGAEIQNDYNSMNYHRPSDEFSDSTWIMDGALMELKYVFQLGKQLASEKEFPGWKPGSEFGSLRTGEN